MTLATLTDSELRAAFWSAQRTALATVSSNDVAFQAAVATKLAIVSEQRARFNARSLARDARVASLLGH